jgi:hypothetical protein
MSRLSPSNCFSFVRRVQKEHSLTKVQAVSAPFDPEVPGITCLNSLLMSRGLVFLSMRRNLIFDDVSLTRTGREHISEASLRSEVK